MHKFIKKFFEWDGIAPGEGGFLAAALQAAPYVLQGISALGGIFGKKKKYLDNEALRQMYGPNAIGKDTSELSNYILNSPYGQQLMASAAEQGQGLQTDMNARAAASGLSPETGASSGASDFQVSAGNQAQTGLERQTRAGIIQSAMPIAADLVGSRMQAALGQQSQQNADPSTMQRIGAAAGQTAAGLPAPAQKKPVTAATGGGTESLTNYMNQPAQAQLPGQAIVNAAGMPNVAPPRRRRLTGGQMMTNSQSAKVGY